jgi:glycosyltransferase involved in cell wall biosynthesis
MQANTKVILLSSDDSLTSKKAKADFFKKHEVKKEFEIVSLHSFSNKIKGSKVRLINWLETIFVNFSIARYIFVNHKGFDVLYFRDSSIFLPILVSKYIFGKPIFMELHAVLHKKHGQFLNNFFSRVSNGIIAISYGLKDYYEKINENIIVSFCAASEPERFTSITESKEELRVELNLPIDKIILMYSGNLGKTGNYDSYGIEDIVNAMPYLDDSVIFVGVGKKGDEAKGHEGLAKNLGVEKRVSFLPWVARPIVSRYRKAADILVLPSSGAQIGNSPTKMFNDLASERVTVSARTQAIEEVLKDGENALLVTDYKNPHEWARVINRALGDKELCDKIIKGALEDGKKYTWNNRGLNISQFILKSLV